jgi:hypothetical protein
MSNGSVDFKLGELTAGVESLHALLEAHTEQDAANFKALSDKIDALSAKVEGAVLKRTELLMQAAKWASGTGAGAVAVIEGIRRIFGV